MLPTAPDDAEPFDLRRHRRLHGPGAAAHASEPLVWHLVHRTAPRRHWEKGDDVVQRRNAVAFERLRCLVYSGEGHSLGPYGLGRARTLRDCEIYAGFDLCGKRVHPDVFTGANPDPVTIHGAEDWDRCVTWEEAKRRGLAPP